jgi:hypothetical protein
MSEIAAAISAMTFGELRKMAEELHAHDVVAQYETDSVTALCAKLWAWAEGANDTVTTKKVYFPAKKGKKP